MLLGIFVALPVARVGNAATLTLANFPAPFVTSGDASGTFVIGLSASHLGLAAASTIDVVGGVALAGAIGDATPTGTRVLNSLLDTEAVDATGSTITTTGSLLSLGGRGSNAVTKLVNSTLPVRQAGPLDGNGRGVYDSETRINYIRTINADTSVDDYALFALSFDTPNNRYFFAALGTSGFATRAITQLIALNVAGPLPSGNVLTGTGVVVKLHDNAPADNVIDTYQVVDGTGGAVIMANPAPLPSPASIGKTFVLGLSQTHLCSLAAANTIDVVGAVSLGVAQARQTSGTIWSVLDTEASDTACTTLTASGTLLALGGRGGNAVSRIVNQSLAIRLEPGKGVYNSINQNGWLRTVVGTAVTEYSYDSIVTLGGRTVEVVAGQSGFATRASAVDLATGTFSRGTQQGIALEYKDNNGDNIYESRRLIDQTAGITSYQLYDLFNVPWKEYWDVRTFGYNDHPVGSECFSQDGIAGGSCTPSNANIPDAATYPYMNWYPAPGTTAIGNPNTNDWVQAPFRMKATGNQIPGYSLAEPVILPVFNYAAAPGNLLNINWKLDYATSADYNDLRVAQGCADLPRNGNDGYWGHSHITVTMDLQESKRIFGVPTTITTAADAQTWWNSNTDPTCYTFATKTNLLERNLHNWYLNQGCDLQGTLYASGGCKYDIFMGYEYGYYPADTNVTAAVDADGTTHVTIDEISEGMEVLVMRWLYWGNTSYSGTGAVDDTLARGWLAMEGLWIEQFNLAASIGATTTNFAMTTAVEYQLTEWSRPGSDGLYNQVGDSSYWWWGPQLIDYIVNTSSKHPVSEVSRYNGVTYIHTTPGSSVYGTSLGYDYAPRTWNMKPGDKLVLLTPTGTMANVHFHDPNLTPKGADPRQECLQGAACALPSISTMIYASHAMNFDGITWASPPGLMTWTPTTGVLEIRGPTNTGAPIGSPTGGYPAYPYPTMGFH